MKKKDEWKWQPIFEKSIENFIEVHLLLCIMTLFEKVKIWKLCEMIGAIALLSLLQIFEQTVIQVVCCMKGCFH